MSTLPLLDRDITLSQAIRDETNILHKLSYPDQQMRFFTCLENHRSRLRVIVAHHLDLPVDVCHVARMRDWLHGSFNVCIPVTIACTAKRLSTKVLVRLPLPYRVGEELRQGNADEKLRCEAGAYTWLEENCPRIPVPKLYGFGLSTGQGFTRLDQLPTLSRYTHILFRKIRTWLGSPVPSRYIRHDCPQGSSDLETGYVIIEYIDETQGKMLSDTWTGGRKNEKLRRNLFRGLCQVLVDLARVPLPRIGSFIIDDRGFLSLNNRPLTLEIQELENEGVPVDIPRHFTYSTVDSYTTDLLALHDARLHHQQNAISNLGDCLYQISALTMMRALHPLFLRREFRRGPYIFSLTDLHASNILVDKNWHVKKIIDLEWASSRPVEFIQPPRWLSDQSVDTMSEAEYGPIRAEFTGILEEVEQEMAHEETTKVIRLSSVMNEGWDNGTFWYSLALKSPTGLCRIFYDHIQPRLAPGHEDEESFYLIAKQYWTKNVKSFMNKKISDKDEYNSRLQEAFTGLSTGQ